MKSIFEVLFVAADAQNEAALFFILSESSEIGLDRNNYISPNKITLGRDLIHVFPSIWFCGIARTHKLYITSCLCFYS